MPVPLREIVCGLFPASSVTRRVAERAPVAPGVNVTEIEQFAPTARLLPQLLVSLKSATLFPVKSMLLMPSVTFWPLVSTAFWGALEFPRTTEPRESPDEGSSEAAPQPGSLKLEMRVFQFRCEPIWFWAKYSF